MTTQIGIKELRGNLGRYLARVREGQNIVVTDYGAPIALISAYAANNPLERLIAQGKVTRAAKVKSPLPPLVKANGSVSELVLEQRG
jgi:prevent-host-death family protein